MESKENNFNSIKQDYILTIDESLFRKSKMHRCKKKKKRTIYQSSSLEVRKIVVFLSSLVAMKSCSNSTESEST